MNSCDGRAALGPCEHRAKYVLSAPHLGRRSERRYACGLHLAQLVKRLLPAWGYVGVGEDR
jgi:hypothetical protein